MTATSGLTVERWGTLPLHAQLLHLGTELKRTQHWLALDDRETATASFHRALDLLDLTIATARRGRPRRELCRVRETLCNDMAAPDARERIRGLTRALVGNI